MMTLNELKRLYGEAIFEMKTWQARAAEYERLLIQETNKTSKNVPEQANVDVKAGTNGVQKETK